MLPIFIHAIVHSDNGWSKLMNKSLTEHELGEDRDSFRASQVVSRFSSVPFLAIRYPIEGGMVTNGDRGREFLMRIQRYKNDKAQHTTLRWSNSVRFGEFSWKLWKMSFSYNPKIVMELLYCFWQGNLYVNSSLRK